VWKGRATDESTSDCEPETRSFSQIATLATTINNQYGFVFRILANNFSSSSLVVDQLVGLEL
jgi:hypothetical protein